MNRLHEIAKELEELDKLAVDNVLYQKASKLYYETAMIQAQDINERNQLMTNFIEQYKQLKESRNEMIQLVDLMYDFIVANGLQEKFHEYFQCDEPTVLN